MICLNKFLKLLINRMNPELKELYDNLYTNEIIQKIVNDINIANVTKQDFLKQTVETYSTFLNEIPTYIDFLSINIPNSLNEVSLHNVDSYIPEQHHSLN